MIILNVIAGIFYAASIIYAGYYVVTSVGTFKKTKKLPQGTKKHKFGVIIAARNESVVIGNLIKSINEQNYGSDLIDIYVFPNNCTDDTAKVAKEAGAAILECDVPIHSKGDALNEIFSQFNAKDHDYDAFCIFDADNLVHPDFFNQMNNALCNGADAAQGYRESKNAGDSWISAGTTIYYWIINGFYNRSRQNIGQSGMFNGTGFMLSRRVLDDIGWHTYTMTEDIEYSAQLAIHGYKIDWVADAVVYDEQPILFGQSWHQRRRWSTGTIQCMTRYFWPLVASLKQKRKMFSLDMAFLFIAPVIQIISILPSIGLAINALSGIRETGIPWLILLVGMAVSTVVAYLVVTAMTYLVIIKEKKQPGKVLSGIFTFWLFMMSWLPINIICFLSKEYTWKSIEHTKSVDITEMMQ